MSIRKSQLEAVPTDLLARRLRKCPTDPLTYEELCRRGDSGLANQIRAGEEEDRRLETMDEDRLTAEAFQYDRALGSSDRVSGGIA